MISPPLFFTYFLLSFYIFLGLPYFFHLIHSLFSILFYCLVYLYLLSKFCVFVVKVEFWFLRACVKFSTIVRNL
jgi:hypothetical protein